MDISVYDFDKSIYDGDSSIDFYIYCLRRHPGIIKIFPVQISATIKYFCKASTKSEWKQSFFSFLGEIDNIDHDIEIFWKTHFKKLKKWYIQKNHNHDIIISASPEFLLKPVCNRLGVKLLIASQFDKKTGVLYGQNCSGSEKVKRLNQVLNDYTILEFYSDSMSDSPLAALAKKKYLVCGSKIINWPDIT